MNRRIFINILFILTFLVILSFTFNLHNQNVKQIEVNQIDKVPIKHEDDKSTILISANSTNYLESEPIWIEIEVNIPQYLKLDFAPDIYPYGDLKLYLTNDNGDSLFDLGGSVTNIYTKEYKDHYYAIFHLQHFFGIPEDFPNSPSAFRYKIPTGNYYLQTRLQLRIQNSIEHFYSNVISFTVNKPIGDELKALNNLLSCENYTFNTPNSILKSNTISEKILEFKNLYPNSKYLSKVEHLILIVYLINPSVQDTFQTYLLRRIQENPNNYYNESYINMLGGLYGNEDLFINELNLITRNNPGTILQKIINSYIKEINFKKSLNRK